MTDKYFLIGFSIALFGNHHLVTCTHMDFKLSTINTNDCAGAGVNYVSIDNTVDCEVAADTLGYSKGQEGVYPFVGNYYSYPKHCYFYPSHGVAYFNENDTGAGQVNSAPICKYVAPVMAGGDPHFYGFNGIAYSFQAMCDTVLFASETAKILSHVRLTRKENYSYIEFATFKVSEDVIELRSSDGKALINGQEVSFVDRKSQSKESFALTRSVQGKEKKVVVYDIDLFDKNHNRRVEVRVNLRHNAIYIALKGNFPSDMIGMLGNPSDNTKLLSRDGFENSIPKDVNLELNDFGQSWQVLDTDPNLFQERREPQFPARCLFEAPSHSISGTMNGNIRGGRRRRLFEQEEKSVVTPEEAAAACGRNGGGIVKQEACIMDVVAFGDIELADEPFYSI